MSSQKSTRDDFPNVSVTLHVIWRSLFAFIGVTGSVMVLTGDTDHLWYAMAILGIALFVAELGIYAYRLTPTYDPVTGRRTA